ncbi:Uncharacterised protein [Bordetella holmesii]|nr:hypothetical protein [Bordetella holmesii]AMD45250.1 hypothetical protein H558_06895 [Bordetella holmesii H558]AOB34137.1 hypothetical protein BBB42_00655 [Bordetella holmesii]SUV90931.1 Uncharacterised protein [Bordetella holmesii]
MGLAPDTDDVFGLFDARAAQYQRIRVDASLFGLHQRFVQQAGELFASGARTKAQAMASLARLGIDHPFQRDGGL